MARCVDMPFRRAMANLGLSEHIGFVEAEARLFADLTVEAFTVDPPDELDSAAGM